MALDLVIRSDSHKGMQTNKSRRAFVFRMGLAMAIANALSGCGATHDEAPGQAAGKPVPSRSFRTFSIGRLPAAIRVTKVDELKAQRHVPRNARVLCPPDAPAGERVRLEIKPPFTIPSREDRYYFPAASYLAAYDLRGEDRRSCPTLWSSLDLLKKLLANRPTATALDHDPRYDFNYNVFPPRNATQEFHVKLHYIDAEWGSGYMVLTQFGQDGGTPANNEEMCCLFQGLAKGGTHLLTGEFHVTHRGLPNLIDQTDDSRKKGDYKPDSAFLNRQADDSFQPSLIDLRQMLESIRLKAAAHKKPQGTLSPALRSLLWLPQRRHLQTASTSVTLSSQEIKMNALAQWVDS